MSLPLWEECAWYVDVPEPELEEPEPLQESEEVYDEEGQYYDYADDIKVDVTSDADAADHHVPANELTLEDEFLAALALEGTEMDGLAVVESTAKLSGEADLAESGEAEPTESGGADASEIGVADPTESGGGAPTASGGAAPTESGEADPTKSSGADPTENDSDLPGSTDINADQDPTVQETERQTNVQENDGDSATVDTAPEGDLEDVSLTDQAAEYDGEYEDTENYEISVDIVDEEEVPEEEPIKHAFPINKQINRRMHLYLGEIYKLPCDAIVVGQVENLRDRLDGNDVIFTLAGIQLEPELLQLAPCTTGDAVVTKGWQMPCEWIIHAVGPKYDERYLEASDHALFSAYKKALLLASEKEVQSLVIGTIYKESKGYPRFDAAHVALRTVRKFLDHTAGDAFDRIMFCVTTQEDFEIYSALMHAYFPRTEEELEDQSNLLPIELGDEWGEIIIPDRVVKVSVGPKPLPVESLQQYKGSASASEEMKDIGPGGGAATAGPKKLGTREIKAIGEGPPRAMTQSDQDPDAERRRKVQMEFAKMSREQRLRLRFQAMVRDLEDDEDLEDMDALQLIHILGRDHKERTVVLLSGANLMRAESMDHDRVLRYLLKRMEPLRCVPFVLIYGCGQLGDERYPDTKFMQSVFDLYSCRYNDTLMKFYILHASFSFRMYFWLLLPLETTTFWSSYTNLTRINSMRHYMDIASLEIPQDLLRYDRENHA